MKITKEYLRKLIKEAIGKTYHNSLSTSGVYFDKQNSRIYVIENGKEVEIDTGGVKNEVSLRNLAKQIASKKGYEFIEEKY